MAKTTNICLRNQVIYQVFPRQYSKTHDLNGVTKDLKRIKDLGVDFIQLLPIHPIGVKDRKGTAGSPYSISDYESINPDLGTMDDFKELLAKAHELGLKVIMDVVFNHTSRDSKLTEEHPEWFYHRDNGEFANRVGDWSDITDFKFNHKETTEYLLQVLLKYVELGVDGFRFDVATLIPYSFFAYAFPKLRQVNPEIFLFAETIHNHFNKYIRDLGYETASDAELYNLFDAEYEYDVNDYLQKYMKGEGKIQDYLSRVSEEEAAYPMNYVKARFIENHDFGTANGFLKDEIRLKNILVLSYFCKGMMFLFNGIECANQKLPNLFEIDEIHWNNYNTSGICNLIKKMNQVKKVSCFRDGVWEYQMITDDLVVITIKDKEEEFVAVINLNHEKGVKNLGITGEYQDVLSTQVFHFEGHVEVTDEPLVLRKL